MATLNSTVKSMGAKNWRDAVAKASRTLSGTPSQNIGSAIAKQVSDPTRQGFIDKYGTEEQLRPELAFLQFAESQVNPEAIRNAIGQTNQYDTSASMSGAWRTGQSQANRQGLVDELDRARKASINQYLQQQNDLFSNWYNKEMEAYMSAKNPSQYQLGKYGLQTPGGVQQVAVGQQPQGLTYNPVDFQSMMQYGGYGYTPRTYGQVQQKPNLLYNMPGTTGQKPIDMSKDGISQTLTPTTNWYKALVPGQMRSIKSY